MSLAEEKHPALQDLLLQCTANVRCGDRSKGAAFFVSNTLLLTSHHVVEGCDDLKVVTSEGRERAAIAIAPNPGQADDLALLRVDMQDSDPAQPAVLLDASLAGDDMYVVGYPVEQGRETGQEGFRVTTHPRLVNGVPDLLQIEPGPLITYGMSGGPVLNLRTGAVAAVVRTSRDPQDALGGGAVPVAVAFERYPELAEFARDTPVAVRRWRDRLGPEAWRLLGHEWELATDVNLRLNGMRKEWTISSEVTSEEGETRTASDLGDDLTEAMFRWAQRQRLSGQAEVELLGRLLARALFPTAVERHLAALSEADRLTVRLHVRAGCGLEDIPWELASIPQRQEFIAADPRFQLVRVDDRVAREGRTEPLPDTIRVLGLTALATDKWVYPVASYGDVLYGWPSAGSIARGFEGTFASTAFELTALGEKHDDLQDELARGRYDVLHYLGVGQTVRDDVRGSDRAKLSLLDSFDEPFFSNADELFKWAREGGVRVVVLEFTGPPIGQRLEPVTISSLREMLGGSVEAVVVTRFPVHPRQFDLFNKAFYASLAAGRTVAEAVQVGRVKLRGNQAVDDWAGFGCFALVTDQGPPTRLVPPQGEAPEQGPRSGVAEPGARAPLTVRPPGSPDQFATRT